MFDTQDDPERAWLAELNEEQRAVAQSRSRSILVVAGAGTGKTKTLAARVAHLIECGASPERILLLTFTRRAAREMIGRAERLSVRHGAGRVWGGTFHSAANRILRAHGRAVGLEPTFTVMDASDGADMIGLLRSEMGHGQGERRFPRKETLASMLSRTVNERLPLPEVVERWFPWCSEEIDAIRDVLQAFVERKRNQGILDYDDLLLYWAALAGTTSRGARLRELFDHILVDEYQDTNRLQSEILVGMRSETNSIMVVGDDAQAIYSFRSATVRNIMEFPSEHPGAQIVKLERNYRSTQPILRASNAVISKARRRYEKELWSTSESDVKPSLITCADESQQSDSVCRRVLEHRERGVMLRAQAVLFRTGHHSAMLELELTRRNIPFVKYGGLKFMEAAHVKDVLCWLRILENPFDELSWFRVLQLLEGVGGTTARRIMDDLGVRRVDPRREPDAASPLQRWLTDPPDVPAAAREDVARWRSCASDCTTQNAPPLQVERARHFFEPIFLRTYDAAGARSADIEQLEQIAAGYPTRARFLTDLTLDPPVSTADLAGPPLLDDDYLTLSTIHSAKGCEWEAVHVIHAGDGMIPSDMSLGEEEGLEEELRLFYVALTRAKRFLHVSFPLRMYHRRAGLDDAHSYAQLTRFLPTEMHDLFHLSASTPNEGDAGDSHAPAGEDPVRAYLDALWA